MSYELETLMRGQQYKKLYEKEVNVLLTRYNLKKIEIDILFCLATDGQCYTARDIATCRCLSKAHISKAVDSLTERGLIEVSQDAKDRRCLQLTVTKRAECIIEDVQTIKQRLTGLIYSGVTEEELVLLEKVAKKITYNIFQCLYTE